MIVIYGFRNAKTKHVDITELTCESCAKSGSIQIQFYQEYCHVFGIPAIPIKRWAVLTCTACGYSANNNTTNADYKAKYAALRPITPIWTYAGLIGCLALFGFAGWKEINQQHSYSSKISACINTGVSSGKIYQVGITDDYKINPTVRGHHKYSKLIKIRTMAGDTISYYEGETVRGSNEDMLSSNEHVNYIDSFTYKKMSLKEFQKLEILNCRNQ